MTHRSHMVRRPAQSGLTLIELMISMTLGMFVIAAGMSLLLSTKSTYVASDDNTRLLDTGRFAIESVTRSLRQASFENLDSDEAPIVNDGTLSPNIDGFDARTYNIGSGSAAVAATPVSVSGNTSDILRIRFFGASAETSDGINAKADKTMLNCAGVPVEGAKSFGSAEQDRGWSIYFVDRPAKGEPELRCGYLNKAGLLESTAIASGVESFQILYGIDSDADGIPDQFLPAATVANTPVPAEMWNRVTAVKLAMLIRGTKTERVDIPSVVYRLFGSGYNNSGDLGTQIDEQNQAQVAAADRSRTRKVFSTLIQLRNTASGGNLVALP